MMELYFVLFFCFMKVGLKLHKCEMNWFVFCVDLWYQIFGQMQKCGLTIMLNFFLFEIYVEVSIICCIYPNISKNYFVSHHMKNMRLPYNCTQRRRYLPKNCCEGGGGHLIFG
jgi:hypothetical protein